jgi:hypothetical protein
MHRKDEIKENARRADELAKQLAEKGALMPADGIIKGSVWTNKVPDVTQPFGETSSSASEEMPTQPEQEKTVSAETKPPVQEEESLVPEKQYRSAVKAMNEAQRMNAETRQKLEQEAAEKANLLKELEKYKTQKVSKKADLEDTDSYIDQLFSENNQSEESVATERNSSPFEERIASVEEQLQIQKEEKEIFKLQEDIRLRDERIKKHHVDYDDIRFSDDFKAWIYGDAPSLYKQVYEGTVQFDDTDAVKVLNDYKSFKSPAAKSSKPKPGAAEVNIKSNSSVVSDMATQTEPEFTAEDINRLPYDIHKIKDPAQRKALMARADAFLSKQLTKNKT